MGRQFTDEQIEEYAMRMSWASLPVEARQNILVMARAALEVADQFMSILRMEDET